MSDKPGRLSRMSERLKKVPGPTPEQAAEFMKEREEHDGTMLEWAQMQDNRDIAVRITDYSAGGGHGMSNFVCCPTDDAYESCRKEYGLEQPGDTRHIKKRWNGTEYCTEHNYLTKAQS